MDPMTQVLLTVTIPTVTVPVGILVNNSRLTDLRNYRLTDLRNYVDMRATATDRPIEDLKDFMRGELSAVRSEMRRMEEVLDARLKHLEERVG